MKKIQSISIVLMIAMAVMVCPGLSHAKTVDIKDVRALQTQDGVRLEIDFRGQEPAPEHVRLRLGKDNTVYRLDELKAAGAQLLTDDDPKGIEVLLPEDLHQGEADFYVAAPGTCWHHAALQGPDSATTPTEAMSASPLVGYCQPQCTTYVQNKTGISFAKCIGKLYRDAKYWYQDAQACGFDRSPSKPKDKSIMVMEIGHVAYVKESDKKSSDKYELTIYHSNWDGACSERKEKVTYYKDDAKVKIGNTKYKVLGFIHGW